ncbi:SVWC domain-containing protein [Trichonephila clavipes]|nr:SVWC domain-containing protein [Trichonephila clavipes]
MHHFVKVFLITVFFLILPATKAYVARELLNTDDGYCNSCTYGRIPLGESDYNDERCERYDCSEGLLTIIGCGVVATDDPKCSIERGEGRYPDCCLTVICE